MSVEPATREHSAGAPTRKQSVTVEVSLPFERLDVYLRGQFPAVSRGAIQRLLEQGYIRVNGQPAKPTHHPRAGETIEVEWPDVRPATAQPEAIPLEVLYEDESLLVLNKPPGLVVHPGAGHEEHTLVNALLHHCRGQLSGIAGVARPGIVHRLDKDTSGCLVVAKTDETHQALSRQFAARQVDKRYHAIVCGELPHDQGDICAAISRHVSHRKRMAVDDDNGRSARTSYRVRERLREATLVEIKLHTGRTHQIRVHFQHIGFPILGDQVYGPRQNRRLAELAAYTAPRQMLHARDLSFNHPRTGLELACQAPWPEDFREALRALRSGT